MSTRYRLTITIILAALLAGGNAQATGVVVKGSVFGGGNEANVRINTSVNISAGTVEGNVYGGGNLGDVMQNTEVNVCAEDNGSGTYVTVDPGTIGVTIKGNVYGGGKGEAKMTPDGGAFECKKGMVGVDGDASSGTGTTVRIFNGTIGTINSNNTLVNGTGNVYGGGQVGRVERNTIVTIGAENDENSEPNILGDVFGAGAGVNTHGYSALVRGNSSVTIQGSATVGKSVYGGGQIASVGKYTVVDGLPTTTTSGGVCTVIIRDKATIAQNVVGAGKGVLPYEGCASGDKPQHMNGITENNAWVDNLVEYPEYDPDDFDQNKPEYANYLKFIKSLALASDTRVTISGEATVNGAVFGGSESGYVQQNTQVIIEETCVIGTTAVNANIFGGGLGSSIFAEAGVVRGNTEVYVNGGTTNGNVYGGGSLGNVHGTTEVNVYANKVNSTYEVVAKGNEPGIITGDVFGGGQGSEDTFTCEKAMVGIDGEGLIDNNGGTTVSIFNGTVNGNVYGGGQVGRVEKNTVVTIGLGDGGNNTSKPIINGDVFGAGKGVSTHGFSALVRGNSTVTVQGDAQIGKSVYGGGQIATVGRYIVKDSRPIKPAGGGKCTVTIQGHAIIGTVSEGDVFGAGKGVLPYEGYTNSQTPWSMLSNNTHNEYTPDKKDDYFKFIQTLACASDAEVTIGAYANVKGSVYGGSENGFVQRHTQVTIQDNCEIGTTSGETDVDGDIYGGGRGSESVEGYAEAGKVKGNTNIIINGGAMHGSVYGGGEKGYTIGSAIVNMIGGTVNHDVYGGGALASTNTGNGTEYVEVLGLTVGSSSVNGLYENTYVITTDQTAVANTTYYSKNGNDYEIVTGLTTGVSDVSSYYVWSETDYAESSGNAQAGKRYYTKTHYTTVNLIGGIIGGDAYGGALGDATHEPFIYGDTKVNLNGMEVSDYDATIHGSYVQAYPATGTTDHYELKTTTVESVTTYSKGVIVNQVFGANNANGTPKGNITVHVFATQNKNTDNIHSKVPLTFTEPEADKVTYWSTQATSIGLTPATIIGSATEDEEKINLLKEAIEANRYDVLAVYGGGNQAAYIPTSPYTTSTPTGAKTQVIIEGCDYTNIETVYGGGNAAAVPETNVEIREAHEILYAFGGGNGKSTPSFNNPGADVGIHGSTNYGTGNANITLIGGYIHEAYGGSNEKGTIKGKANLSTDPDGGCDLEIGKMVGAGKNADIDGDVLMKLDCMPTTKIPLLFAGADNANVYGNVELTITNGTFGKVFGGNNEGGAIFGRVKVNVEETGCRPINIDELYTCGNEAAYSVYGYKNVTEGGQTVLRPRTSLTDGTAVSPASNYSSTQMYADPELNITSCTYIGQVFGGGLGSRAIVYGNPKVNINMAPGAFANQIDADGDGSADNNADALGAVVDVYGGGNKAAVYGNTMVNIGTTIGQSVTLNTNATATITGANITGTVYGAGKGKADDPNAAIVTGNTLVNMAGGHVNRSIYGGGELSSVGTFTEYYEETSGSDTDADYHVKGEPKTCAANTGLTEVIISGGRVGLVNQLMPDPNEPTSDDDYGYVFCAGKGMADPTQTNGDGVPYANLLAVCGSSHLEISGTALIAASVYGGSENGQVLGDTYVEIKGGQIGSGHYKDGNDVHHWDDPYTEAQWTTAINAIKSGVVADINSAAAVFHECDAWTFGAEGSRHVYDHYATYLYDGEYYYDEQHTQSARGGSSTGSDGHSYYGHVFGGGSGYYPYAAGQWRRTAGRVNGNTTVTITGGHILTNVYGGNEITDVLGKSTVTMTGGTVGVPRTLDGIQARPVNSYIFGAGMGDPRTFFNGWSNVGSSEVKVGGNAVVFGSVFGGGEDGHVLGNSKTTIEGNAVIGTFGTSGVDGNIFGSGRGFSAIALTAGVICGNITVDIKENAKILGSVYGGGRLAAVGTYLVLENHANYGKLIPEGQDPYGTGSTTHGNVTVNITGGTIGTLAGINSNHAYSVGDVFGGSKGTLMNDWAKSQKLGLVKNTTVNISQADGYTTTIYGNVYGGGEIASVGSYAYATSAQASTYNTDHSSENMYEGDVYSCTEGGLATILITGGTIGQNSLSDTHGSVFGGCLGKAGTGYSGYSYVNNSVVTLNGGTVYGCVFGGGENGHVYNNTDVNIKSGTVGIRLDNVADANLVDNMIYRGNVYGGGRGIDLTSAGDYSITAGKVRGNTNVTVEGGQIYRNVYGGGSLASVGVREEAADDNNKTSTNPFPYATGLATVTIKGGQIGTDGGAAANDHTTLIPTRENRRENGFVFGSGRGMAAGADGNSTLVHLAYTNNTLVNIEGTANVTGSVFGGGENGHTRVDTKVYVKGGTVGTELTADEHAIDDNGRGRLLYRGNVYGGGRGIDLGGDDNLSLTAGRVYGNTFLEVSGGKIYHDIFGGGSLASVGNETVDAITDEVTYGDDSGLAEVHIKGGIIGYSSTAANQGFNCGFVYGGCRGLSANPNSNVVKMAYVHNTKVYIEDGADIKGSVFGGGANGHVKNDTYVEISGGSIGTALTVAEATMDEQGVTPPIFRGNVYAGGRGVDQYYTSNDEPMYSMSAGAIYGNAELKMTGGHVWHNIYGSGAMASVGSVEAKPTGTHVHDEVVDGDGNLVNDVVYNPDESDINYLTGVFKANTGTVTMTITGGTVGDTTPGHEGINNGNVFGAGRGVSADRSDYVASMEYVNKTYVTIGTSGQTDYSGNTPYPYIYGNVYGGGENGHVKTDTDVKIHSGIIGFPLVEGDGQKYKTANDGSTKNPYRGHVFGGGCGIDPLYHGSTETRSSTAGRVYGHTNVTMTGGVVRRAIYGGGLLASVGIYRLLQSDMHITDMIEDEVDGGNATVTVSGGYIGNVNPDGTAISGSGYLIPGDNNGHIFGSSCGMVADDYEDPTTHEHIDVQYRQMGYAYSTYVNISGDNTHIFGSIFGSGENGHVWEDANINIIGGEIGSENSSLIYTGNVYGSGRGVDHPHQHISETAGKVRGNTTVNMTGGIVWNDVYGGGSQASVGVADEVADDNKKNVTTDPTTNNPFPYSTGLTRVVIDGTSVVHGSVYGSGRGVASTNAEYIQAAYVKNTLVTIKGTAQVYKNVFGGGNAGHVRKNTDVTIDGSAWIGGNVYGGGAGSIESPTAGLVNHDVTVNIKGGEIAKDVYGGGAIANTNVHDKRNTGTYGNPSEDVYAKTEVNLTGGTIMGDAYGGGQGVIAPNGATAAEIANAGALVYGDVTVTLDGTAFKKRTGNTTESGTGRVFGCNNLNGTPKGDVTVIVYKTSVYDSNGQVVAKPDKNSSSFVYTNPDWFELKAVYGGGNKANYEPFSGQKTQVNIYGCDETSIMHVYGSGNSADVPESDVIIWESYVIGTVFGGGNGSEEGSPGANVTGLAKITLNGGEIYDVFGGSNTKGTCGNTEINDKNTSGGECPLKLRNMYGAGKSADVIGNVTVDITGCNTSEGINVYAGSYDAKITGGVTLNITGGILNNVFAGNNAGGSIGGPILVNVEETDDCKPIIINNLYGGGNMAAYPGTGAKTYIGPANPTDIEKENPDNYTDFNSGQITLNVRSCTYIGNIFGGGYGNTADVIGNTEVNINLTKGNWAGKTYNNTTIPNALGTIGNVYGGGNEGKVDGDAVVNIGTDTKTYYVKEPIQFRANPSTPLSHIASGDNQGRYEATVEGAHISGNVYGGGNLANVTGNTYVIIRAVKGDEILANNVGTGEYNYSAETTLPAVTLDANNNLTQGVLIGGNVYGGGKGKADNFTCDKAMVGVDEQGVDFEGEGEDAVYTLRPGGTNVHIGNGTVNGNVYGGGEIARVERNTQVTIGLPAGEGTSSPVVKGSVFAAGAGVVTHGYSALTRGISTVTVQEQAQVWNNVYGGGELASVGRYWVASTPALATAHNVSVGMPYGLKAGGTSTVVIQGNATIGDENIANSGNVFGAGMGIEPLDYDYASGEDGVSGYSLDDHKPKRMMNYVAYDSETGKGHNPDDQNKTWKYYVDEEGHEDQRYVWEYFANRTDYLKFIETLALSAETDVTIKESATVKGSVYGGSQKGFVYRNTDVKIQNGTIENDVYGGGLGLASYSKAGQVGGNTYVTISNGAIKRNVYGGGKLGPVGTFAVSDDMRSFYWTNTLLANIDPTDPTTYTYNNTGVCNVTISGGAIGISGVTMNNEGSFANGNVFGSGKGLDDTFWCEKGIAYKTNVNINAGTVNGNVYGGGEVGRVETTADVKIGPDTGTSSPNIVGNVFGGGAGVKTHGYSGLIRGNTYVTVQSEATVGHNVYGGGQIAAVGKYYLVDATYKENHPESNLEIGMPYSLVSDALGISNVTIKGNATITGNVFGAGKGKEPETYTFADNANRPKRMMSYNTALFTESNHSIWEFADTNEKYVWEYFDTKPKYQTFLETLGLSTQAFVTIGGTRNETTGVVTASGEPTVNGSVFGGSESGFVQHHTSVTIAGGTIGTTTTGGDVFGGGLGTLSFAEAGRVRGNTTVNIQGGAVNGNVYGGGSLGDVGTITKSADYNYTWKQDDGNTANSINNNTITGTNNNTGVCTVTVSGGVIGIDNPSDATKHGNVFGAGRGSSTTWWCEKAIAYATDVSVTGGTVKGNVYGGGEVGRVEDDAKVTIGTQGGTTAFTITGSVYGAGAGLPTHGYSALVRGNSDVTVQGKARIGGSVYGGGEIASVGRFKVVGGLPSKPQAGGNCTVTIQDDAQIGTSGTGHNVFGACKGVTPAYNNTVDDVNRSKSMQLYNNRPKDAQGNEKEIHTYWDYYEPDNNFVWVYYPTEAAYLDFLKTLALTSNTDVTISGNAEIYGSVYGGGERGITLGGVDVNMLSGTVHEDVCGGGSLADANVAMWDAANQKLYDYVPLELIPGLSHVTGYYTKSGNDYTLTSNDIAGEGEANSYYAQYKTNVNLLGGIIGGNAYGGGLGDLENLGTGHSNMEAHVYGDVKVSLNGLEKADYSNFHAKYPTFTLAHVDGDNSDYMIPSSGQKGAIVNKVFGANNLNGTPMAHVKVHVFATQNANTNTIAQADKYGHPVQGEKGYENETMAEYLTRLAAFYPSSSTASSTAASLISAAQTANTAYNDAIESEKEEKLTALNNAITAMNTELNKFYDMEAVYGGGNLAKYEPADPTPSTPYNDTEEFTEVIIDGCGYTSIKQVYGGGNAAPAAATYVCVNGTYEIDEVFGGGNGADSYTMKENGIDIWHENPGANVGYRNYTHWESSTSVDSPGNAENPYHLAVNNTTSEQGGDASTADLRRTNYGYGTGVATTDIRGGTIHYVFGGSNKKGNISTTALSVYSEADDGCLITIHESYGGGKDAPIDGEINVTLDCVKEMDMIFGGSKNADINNNITLNITNGYFKKVFGGNNTSGAINGSITVNIEEKGCVPIQIDELYGGGYLAPYSIYGYEKYPDGSYKTESVSYVDDDNVVRYLDQRIPLTSGVTHKNDPRINIISASRIGTVYGGGYQAKMVGSPHVNVNMTEGKIPSQYVDADFVGNHKDSQNNILWIGKKIATSSDTGFDEGDGILEIGTIDSIFGGGNLADIVGNTYVEIGTGKWISWDDQGNPIWETEDASGNKYKSSQTSNAVTYSQAECNAYNKNLKGYIASTKVLTSAQATAVNTKLGTSYNENDVIYVEDAVAYNATLEGLRKTTDVKTPAVYYTQAECDEYNSAHNLSIGDAGYRKNTDIKTPAVYYTQAECSAYNAENITDYIACTATLEAKKAVAVNEAIGANYAAGATIYTEDAAAFNATLNGYLTTADVKIPAEWTWYNVTAPTVAVEEPTPARNAANITGDVYGGGKGLADNFTCNKAMVGVDGDGVNNPDGGTNVTIANGTIGGSVYGGGKIARVEKNTVVTIGLGDGVDETTSTPTSAPVINGNVFGAGKGVETHGYSALVRGNPTVIIQGNAKVGGSVYGGGEIASVARYKVVNGSPVALANKTSGNCKVIIRGYAEVGPDNMKMNNTTTGKPDNTGHVFGAGKGVLPKIYSYADNANKPRRMLAKGTPLTSGNSTSEEYDANNIWEYFGNDEDYHKFIETLALSSKTDVTITDHAFVKGSVYGGSQNGIVQYNTHVTIDGDCQIGAGEGENRRYTPEEWAYDGSDNAHSLRECAHWDYDITSGAPYDPFAKATGQYDYTESNYWSIPDSMKRSSTAGGMAIAKDGHTYYGNVFGGGSGVEPYAPGLWHRAAGLVRGNTVVDITGGHILTSVYGGNEHTDVGIYDNAIPVSGGLCTVNFGGTATLGVPRTLAQIAAHPVTCYLFGAGKGDTRIFFNTWTNIREAEVNITGGKIFGSVFGGGEDGHVLENITVNINEHDYTTNNTNTRTLIGTTGTSYVDGNVFGAGRGFTGDALTAGSVGGNVEVNISGGIMLGSIYGGGRLASVGTQFTAPNDLNYGNFVEDGNGKTYGHVTVNISGGTIGNENATGSEDAIKHSGNVFGGSMGRLDLLDNTTRNPIWPRLAQVKTAAVNIYGNARILRNVYGGGELGTVRDNAFVTVGGYLNPDVTNGSIPNPVTSDLTITKTDNDNPTIERDVYGGGYGSEDRNHTIFTVTEPRATATAPFSEEDYEEHTYAFTPMQFAGCVGKNTYVNIVGGWIKKNTYGGGEMASVGIIDCLVEEISNADTTLASVVIQRGAQKSLIYKNMRDHSRSIDNDDRFLNFGISWPFEFSYVTGYKGTTHVNVTGGRLGITGKDYMGSDNTLTDEQKEKLREDNGDVFGAGKGIAGDFHQYVFCANVDSSEVHVNIINNDVDPTNYKNLTLLLPCITGSVYAGSENGHVLGNTKLTLENGLIGHAIYGGGKGKGTYNVWLKEIPEGENGVSNITDNDDPSSEVSAPETRTNGTATEYKATIYSITAGKVFGNTNVTMTGGYVMRNVYGGGNMGSVGKGNYSGGQDDYSARGYGELPPYDKDLWSTSTYQENETNYAWHFLNSGKSTVTITRGTIGYIDPEDPSKSIKDGLPYGNVFGGCRGESAPNIGEKPRYQYSPSSYSGYVNETEVTIGNGISGPTILGSVYGGGQDGHVRRDTKVIINNGVIGIPFSSDNQETLGTDLTDAQWQHRGNVYGAGSGIGKYEYDFNYDGDYLDVVDYYNLQTGRITVGLKEKDYSTSAGSVTRFTYVEINDGTIYHNVYGGGSNASIGAPKIPPITDYQYRKGDTQAGHGESKQTLNEVIINGGTIGSTNSRTTGYGGNVYGASRGMSELIGLGFATSVWTNVEAKSGYIYGNIFGGGEAGSVFMDTKVIIGGKVAEDENEDEDDDDDTDNQGNAPRRAAPAVQPNAAAAGNSTPANVATEAPVNRSITTRQAQ